MTPTLTFFRMAIFQCSFVVRFNGVRITQCCVVTVFVLHSNGWPCYISRINFSSLCLHVWHSRTFLILLNIIGVRPNASIIVADIEQMTSSEPIEKAEACLVQKLHNNSKRIHHYFHPLISAFQRRVACGCFRCHVHT